MDDKILIISTTEAYNSCMIYHTHTHTHTSTNTHKHKHTQTPTCIGIIPYEPGQTEICNLRHISRFRRQIDRWIDRYIEIKTDRWIDRYIEIKTDRWIDV